MMARPTLLAGVLVVSVVLLPIVEGRALGADEMNDKAAMFVDQLSKKEFVKAARAFDGTLRRALPSRKLQEAWAALVSQNGEFKRQTGVRTEKEGGFEARYVACEFEKAMVDVKIVFNQNGQIAGLWFLPSHAKLEDEPPPYIDQDAFKEEEVTAGSEEWALPGTLSLPKGAGPFPAVALVHGSGPHDRDETVGPNKPFRDLAWGVASRGIAVLRYDKRTRVHAGELASAQITVNEETVEDAVAAVDLLRKRGEISAKRIFVLGHSLGGMLIPRIGKRDPEIAGFILMAGSARPLEDVILEQMNYIFALDGGISDEEKAALEEMAGKVAKVKEPELSTQTPSSSLPFGAPASYWLDLRGYDAPSEAKTLKQPMLVIQGGRDYQVTMEDFGLWKGALSSRDDVVFKVYPSLNHLFVAGKGKSTPREYERPGHVAEEVVGDIADWIKDH